MARRTTPAQIVDLAAVRNDARKRQYRERLRRVLDGNQQAISRLFHSGLLFTRQGTRAGRDLLLARQHLVRVSDLVQRLEPADGAPAAAALYDELEDLLDKSDRLALRTDELVSSLV